MTTFKDFFTQHLQPKQHNQQMNQQLSTELTAYQLACDRMIDFYRENQGMFQEYLSEPRQPSERKAFIKDIYERLNYTANTTINQLSTQGAILYRGISAESEYDIQKYTQDFSTGEVVFGKKASLHGTGIYMTTNKQEALKYAKYHVDCGSIIQCLMTDDVKIANCEQLETDKEAVLSLMISQNQDNRDILRYTNLLEDNGVFAAIAGYDAINIPEKEYMLVLNRGALFVEDIRYHIHEQEYSQEEFENLMNSQEFEFDR